jgi:hypothetical protein
MARAIVRHGIHVVARAGPGESSRKEWRSVRFYVNDFQLSGRGDALSQHRGESAFPCPIAVKYHLKERSMFPEYHILEYAMSPIGDDGGPPLDWWLACLWIRYGIMTNLVMNVSEFQKMQNAIHEHLDMPNYAGCSA